MAGDCSVGTDVEVRQRRGTRAALSPVGEERLACEECRLVGQGLAAEDVGGDRFVELLDGGEADRDLGVDDRVDDERAVVDGVRQSVRGPLVPGWVLGGDIEQDVAVDEGRAHGWRVRARISSVVMRETARPRRRWITRSPRDAPGFVARTILTVSPSMTNSTSVSGRNPNCSRMSAGIVTCPFEVTRMAEPDVRVIPVRVRHCIDAGQP